MEEKTGSRREYMRAYRRKNAERIRKQQNEWRRNNKEKVQSYQERYWAKRLAEVQATETEASKAAIKSGE